MEPISGNVFPPQTNSAAASPVTELKVLHREPWGATITENGVYYRIWSPDHALLEVQIIDIDGNVQRTVPMVKDAEGFHHILDEKGVTGDLYKFHIDGNGAFPDPTSRQQAGSVHAPSIVVNPHTFEWTDQTWKRPAYRDLVIYELHTGTFTPSGDFRGIIDKLPYLKDLGINAIELLPIGDFPGSRNWGYDGVLIYAPASAYGSPDNLRALVDAAHQQGIAVILDVVYNHFGPDGNYLACYSKHFTHPSHRTPWGSAFNLDSNHSQPVRDFFAHNTVYWMEEFHIDGFRLDATHEIPDVSERHLFATITDSIHQRGGYAIAEDPRNDAKMLTPTSEGGYGFDGVWADDFHHSIRCGQIVEREGYYTDYSGALSELIDTLKHGWLFRGQTPMISGSLRGTECLHLPPTGFVHCISNHDQTGNTAFGERLHHILKPSAHRALSALLCLSPYTPMLFMGQEWATKAPFLFFTDHHEELGKLVTAGRRSEFSGFSGFKDPAKFNQIPDPQALTTFEKSKLTWNELSDSVHQQSFDLHAAFLALRKASNAFRPLTRDTWQVEESQNGIGVFRCQGDGEDFLILFDLAGGHEGSLADEPLAKLPEGRCWEFFLSTEEERFGGEGSGFVSNHLSFHFKMPETVVLRSLPN